ncbi:MAG TPA: hypothetical protein ENN14_00865 [Chloroflexi bacterium]|nr:hypothetical protein [Chloroflexota bacterium]
MDTTELMQVGMALVGFDMIPEDSAIYVSGVRIKRVLFGLDIGVGELLLAHQRNYDAVIAHHPVGMPHRAWRVFKRHEQLLIEAGVPEDVARAAIAPKLEQLRVDGLRANYERVPIVAQYLRLPFLNIHSPLDELGRRMMQSTANDVLKGNPEATVRDVANALASFPAARRAETEVEVMLGNPQAPAGKVVVAHGAYTNGGYHVARAYFEHGVDTVVYIHITANDLQRLREEVRGNLIVTGHLVGDAYGIAPYIAALRAKGIHVDVLSQVLAGPEMLVA